MIDDLEGNEYVLDETEELVANDDNELMNLGDESEE